MRLVFAGTPEFSVSALDALQAAGHEIAGVFTQPDRPAGRGRRLTASAVAQRAATMGLPVFKPDRLGGEAQQQLRDLRPDAMVVVAYGLILPRAVLDIPVHGCLNIHASLLPRWRGAAPIQRAIEAGDTESGVTIMRMDAGLDTGPMLLRESLPITEETTGGELHDALAALGARLIVEALRRLERGELAETPQPASGACYARKLDKEEARVRWSEAAAPLARRIRAFSPAPGAWCELDGMRVRLLAARAGTRAVDAAPGSVLAADAAGVVVACGEGAVTISALQFAGGGALTAQQAAQSRVRAGQRFA
jgi:methionyl-tRNA formyltransferase